MTTLREELKRRATEYGELFKGADGVESAELSRRCGHYFGMRDGIQMVLRRIDAGVTDGKFLTEIMGDIEKEIRQLGIWIE